MSLDIGLQVPETIFNRIQVPVRNTRSLFESQLDVMSGSKVIREDRHKHRAGDLPIVDQEDFTDITAAIKELQAEGKSPLAEVKSTEGAPSGQSGGRFLGKSTAKNGGREGVSPSQKGSGISDIVAASLKFLAEKGPSLETIKSFAEKGAKVVRTAKAIGETAQAVSELIASPAGTKISNVLSETFGNNPHWMPGFAGEKHLLIPTDWGPTRGNYIGPGTHLDERLARGDIGVDGPNGVDVAARTHDILYSLAKSVKDIRDADNRLIDDINKSSQGSKTKKLLIAGLRAKQIGEDVGVFGPETFTEIPGLQKGKGLENPAEYASAIGDIMKPVGMPIFHDPAVQVGGRLIQGPDQDFNPSGGGIKQVAKKIKEVIEDLPPLPVSRLRDSLLESSPAKKIKGLVGIDTRIIIDPKTGSETKQHCLCGKKGKLKDECFCVSGKKKKGKVRGGNYTSSATNKQLPLEQHGGQFAALAGLLGSIVIPKIIKAIKGKKKKKKGKGQAGGQFGALAGLAASFIVPEIVKLFKKKKKKGKGLVGAEDMSGGQFGLLAGLAAKFIVPLIVKAVKKKVKKKKKK
jgi:hypothetical protein